MSVSRVSSLDENTNDSDDDAPEGISLSQGKAAALKLKEQERTAVETLTQERKRKARERQEKHKLGKIAKVSKPHQRIPEEVLNALTDDAPKEALLNKKKESNYQSDQGSDIDNRVVAALSDNLEGDLTDDSKVNARQNPEYVIGNTHRDNTKKKGQGARNFLKSHLYGRRLSRANEGLFLSKRNSNAFLPANTFIRQRTKF